MFSVALPDVTQNALTLIIGLCYVQHKHLKNTLGYGLYDKQTQRNDNNSMLL